MSDSDKDKPITTTEDESAEAVESGSGRWWPLLLVFIALLLAAGSLWWSYQLQQKLVALGEETEAAQLTTTNLTDQQDQDRKRINRVNAGLDNQERLFKSVQQQQRELADSLQQVQTRLEQRGNEQRQDPEAWVLGEAVYLITIANQRLQLAADTRAAETALKLADERLQSLERPGLLPVRQHLASEINALRAVQPVDISGIALYLADLIDRVGSMPVKGADSLKQASPDLAQPAASGETDTQADWQQLLKDIWTDVRSLLVIREKTDADAVLFDPQRYDYLYQNLRLEMASARLSALRRDSANFHTSLQTINQWLEAYFDTANAAVSTTLKTNQALLKQDLSPALPKVDASLESLRAYIRQQQDAAS